MKWIDTTSGKLPIKSWCEHVEPGTMTQAVNLSNHSKVFHHVALMPDCHLGYGMPIGGVIACVGAVIPNAVGVDIGCGMCALNTTLDADEVDLLQIRKVLNLVKRVIPVGEGHAHREKQEWEEFSRLPGWLDSRTGELAFRNLGTLGGGNHFMEMQKGDDGHIHLMIHSGSRNLGYRIARHHHEIAKDLCEKNQNWLPDNNLAWLPADSNEGRNYIREMIFALEYAAENRRRIMRGFKGAVSEIFPGTDFLDEVNIHHNYASPEKHFGRDVWVHRKGATSARKGETGIVPGSMGTSSYLVRGLGNPESFESCSHGAGRKMGRLAASRNLSRAECDRSMKNIVFDGWKRFRKGGGFDLGEAPGAYKDIETVMESQSDLAESLIRLQPLGVVKG